MKKLIKVKIPTVQQLRAIPQNFVPAALKNGTIFNKIKKISVEYQKSPKAYGQFFQFLKQQTPRIKFNNPQFQLHRRLTPDGPLVPIVKILGPNNEILEEFQAGKYKTVQSILNRLKQLDKLEYKQQIGQKVSVQKTE